MAPSERGGIVGSRIAMDNPSGSRSGAAAAPSSWSIHLDEGDFYSGDGCDWDDSYASRQRCERGEDEEQENRFRFMDLGDRLTTAGTSSPLDEFRLRLTRESSFDMAHRWIRRALTHRPAALVLRNDVESSPYLERPEFSFAEYCRASGAFTCRLRTLHLHGVTLEREFADAIFDELPVLEYLQLEDCRYSFTCIDSRSLRTLAIDGCSSIRSCVDVLVLAVPRLTTLRIHGDSPPVAAECEMPYLDAASLEHPAGDDGLLGSLRHARKLSLYGFGTKAFLDDSGEEPGKGLFPVFHDLKNLVLGECDVGVECQVLRRFLQNAPRLETLTLRCCRFSGGSRRKKSNVMSNDGRRVPASYECQNLKSIELEDHEDQDVSELNDMLEEISKKVVRRPFESSLQHGKRTVKISFT
ncbi:unnamed protein product [Urochloa humidicola]